MRRWLLLLGGPLIWAAHFLAVYAIASVSVVIAGETNFEARALIVSAGALAALAAMMLIVAAWRMPRDEPIDAFWRVVALAGATIGLVAVVWQTLPALAPI
jgi:hypothetical protein